MNYSLSILQYTDYYPYGMLMPGRHGEADNSDYRYGFNGMEKDNEVKGAGNSYDFGARMYDSRLGRWLSLDNHSTSTPWDSPYSGLGNRPIYYYDFDGNKIRGGIRVRLLIRAHIKKAEARKQMAKAKAVLALNNGDLQSAAVWNSISQIHSDDVDYYKEMKKDEIVYQFKATRKTKEKDGSPYEAYMFNIQTDESRRNKAGKGKMRIGVDLGDPDKSLSYAAKVVDQFKKREVSFVASGTGGLSAINAFGKMTDEGDIRDAGTAAIVWYMDYRSEVSGNNQVYSIDQDFECFIQDDHIQTRLRNKDAKSGVDLGNYEGYRRQLLGGEIYYDKGKEINSENHGWQGVIDGTNKTAYIENEGWSSPKTRKKALDKIK